MKTQNTEEKWRFCWYFGLILVEPPNVVSIKLNQKAPFPQTQILNGIWLRDKFRRKTLCDIADF